MNKTNTQTNASAATTAQIICEPGAMRGKSGAASTAYEAAMRVTDRATKHCAVDIGAKAAKQHQRVFASAVYRLVRLLVTHLPDHTFTIRFLDSRQSAKACQRNWDSYKQLAVQLTICSGDRISYDVALSHAYGSALCSFIEQTTWPHRGCGWQDGTTAVRSIRASKMMSYHAKRIMETPSSVYASEK